MKLQRWFVAGAFALAFVALPAGAYADHKHHSDDRAYSGRYGTSQVAYDNGYRDGLNHGERDRRNGEDYSYKHSDSYKDGDRGYRREYGSKGQYKQAYRSGYEAGYSDGYYDRRRAGVYGSGYPYPTQRQPYPTYPSGPYPYPSGQYPYPPVGTTGSIAFERGSERGYQQGLRDGYEDFRDRRSYDVTRHGSFRSGDQGYDRRYGPKVDYEAGFRDGFQRGYAEGYRGAGGVSGRGQRRFPD